jgi:hypothetical protein
MPTHLPTSWTAFSMIAQIFVAFGQGAGQLNVSDDAVQAAVSDYGYGIEQADGWGDAAPMVLGIARAMGQAAAEHALREGRGVITAVDYRAARAVIHSMSGEGTRLMGRCPWPTAR